MRFGIRESLFLLVLLAMPVAAYFFVFEPRNSQIAEARDDIAAKQARLAQLDTATAGFSNLGNQIDELTRAVALFQEKLPAGRETYVIVNTVAELAASNRLTVRQVRPDRIVPAAEYAELPIRMTIVGGWSGFYQFLQELERLPRITQVPRMELTRLTGDQEGLMEADVVLSIFFEGEAAAQPDPS
jgi:type IV pilus assembly protein PilO